MIMNSTQWHNLNDATSFKCSLPHHAPTCETNSLFSWYKCHTYVRVQIYLPLHTVVTAWHNVGFVRNGDSVFNPFTSELIPPRSAAWRDFLLWILLLEPCISFVYLWKTYKCNNYSFSLLIIYDSSYTHHVTTHNTPIYNILSTAPQLSISQKALGTDDWMTMQNIRTRHEEEKWSLHQFNFLAGSRKTVQLACRSEDWI
jgi:hypothetical protein